MSDLQPLLLIESDEEEEEPKTSTNDKVNLDIVALAATDFEQLRKEEEKTAYKSVTRLAKVDWRRLFRLLAHQKASLAAAVALLVAASSVNMALPLYFGRLVDAVNPINHSNDDDDAVSIDLNNTALLMLAITVASFVLMSARNIVFTLIGERVAVDLRKQVFASVIVQELAFFDAVRTGELMSRISSDTTVVSDVVTIYLSQALRSIGMCVATIGFLFNISMHLTLLMLLVVPVLILVAICFGRVGRRLSKQVQDALALAMEVANEVISDMRTVRSFSMETVESTKYNERVEKSYVIARKRAFYRALFGAVVSAVFGVALIGVLWYGGKLVLRNQLTAGALTSFVVYTGYLVGTMTLITESYAAYQRAVGASERVFALIDRTPNRVSNCLLPPEATCECCSRSECLCRVYAEKEKDGDDDDVEVEGNDGGGDDSSLCCRLEFDSVQFSYPTRPQHRVLRGVSFTIEKGENVCIVGKSGAGKSSCASLALALYAPSNGRVLVDGIDLSHLNDNWWRRQVSTVSQEPTLFAGTIAENIAYGAKREGGRGVSRQAIERAARLANAHEFIEQFPDKYNTTVGERGVRLSGGQKQRVAIARAILCRARLLILDEATSALSSEDEHLVQEALGRLRRRRTTLTIAHRLSTVTAADKIVVLKNGRAVEAGTHDQLMKKAVGTSYYQQLIHRQLTHR